MAESVNPTYEELVPPAVESALPSYDEVVSQQQVDAVPDYAEVMAVKRQGEDVAEEDYSDTERLLPDTWEIAGFDTDIDMGPEAASFLVGAGSMMMDTIRGVKQMVGVDEEVEKESQRAINKLFADEKYGGFTTAGAVVGALAEPLGLFIPAAKGVGIAKAIGMGVSTGALFGATGYVDVEAEQTRLGNTLIGATLGGTLAGTIKGGAKGVKAVSAKRAASKANKVLDSYEMEWARKIADGASNQDARKALLAENPKLGGEVVRAFRESGRMPHTLLTQDEARQIVSLDKLTKKPIDIVLGRVTDIKAGLFKGVDTVGGELSTRVKQKSEAVFGRLRKYENNIRIRPHKMITDTDAFTKHYSNLSELGKKRVDAALLNGDYNAVSKIYSSQFNDEGIESVKSVMKVMRKLGEDLEFHHRIKGKIKNYFPRYINDKKGMLSALGKDDFKSVKDALEKAAIKKGDALTPVEESDLINKFIRRPIKPGEGGPALTKQRKFNQVPAEFMRFYSNPIESMHTYINNAVIDIEKAKFFGKGFIKAEHNAEAIDIYESIGGLLRKEIKAGTLSQTDLNELTHMLNIRFGIGEKPAIKIVQDVKNLMYAALLGNPVSAATQLGDIAGSVFINGFKPTLKAVGRTLIGTTEIKVKDFGLVDKLAEEFASTKGTAKVLNFALRWGGFEAVDRLGKSTLLNASLDKHVSMFRKLAKSPTNKAANKGYNEFVKKYRNVFGGDFAALEHDLRRGEITDNVKFMLFNELSDMQPISLSEMPLPYLQMPNGKIAYAFKTFMLKQFDILRREAWDKIKVKETRAEGFKRLFTYGAIIGTGNTGSQYVKDWMLGRDIEPMPHDIFINFFKTLGWSEYTENKLKEGKIVEAGLDTAFGPIRVFDRVMSNPEDAVRFAPIFGRMYHQWFGGGLEKDAEKQREKRRKLLMGEE